MVYKGGNGGKAALMVVYMIGNGSTTGVHGSKWSYNSGRTVVKQWYK